MGLRVALRAPDDFMRLRRAEIALNVTNLANVHGFSTLSISQPTNTYSADPIPPRQYFVTLSGAF